jgi:hypothetical protein
MLLQAKNINIKKEALLELCKTQQQLHKKAHVEANDLTKSGSPILEQSKIDYKKRGKLVRRILSPILLVAAVIFLFGQNQLIREHLTSGTDYVVTKQSNKLVGFVFNVNEAHSKSPVRSSYIAFYNEMPTSTVIKRLTKAMDNSPMYGGNVDKSGLKSTDNVFDTDIQTSKIWDSKNSITFEFANKKFITLSNFSKSKNGVQTAQYKDESGSSFTVNVRKE